MKVMVQVLLKVGSEEEHIVVVSACSISEGVNVLVDGEVALDTTAPRPPGIAEVEIGKKEKHLLRVLLKEGIVCRIDVFVDDKLVCSRP